MDVFYGLLITLAAMALYWAPVIVAARRRIPHKGSIIVVNAFAGWTVVGWIVALAMACRSVPERSAA